MNSKQHIILFYRSTHPFSNFYKTFFEMGSFQFISSEQAFMHAKAVHFKDDEIAEKILSSTTPAGAKSLGHSVKGYDEIEWDSVRLQYMIDILMAKFSQNKKLKTILLDTGDSLIAEASPSDKVWGIGFSETAPEAQDPSKWRGRNLLGQALMVVRANLLDLPSAN